MYVNNESKTTKNEQNNPERGEFMRDFKLSSAGDVVIDGGQVALIEEADLTAQNVERLISTNRGEWWLNTQMGVDFKNILGKNPNLDLVRNEIQQALLQMDEGLVIERFTHKVDGRVLNIEFTASNKTGETTTVQAGYSS